MRNPIWDIYISPSKNDNESVISGLIEIIDREVSDHQQEEIAKEIKELLDDNGVIYE